MVLYVKVLLQKDPQCTIYDIVRGQLRSAVWCECAIEMCQFLCQQFCRSSLPDLSVLSNDTRRLLRWLRDPRLWGFSQRIYKDVLTRLYQGVQFLSNQEKNIPLIYKWISEFSVFEYFILCYQISVACHLLSLVKSQILHHGVILSQGKKNLSFYLSKYTDL